MKEELKFRFGEAVKLKDDGDLEAAKSILEDLSDKDPRSAAIFAVLGDVCWSMKLLDDAVHAFRCAVALAPTLEAVSLGLFHCLWQLGKREEALEETKRFMSVADSDDYRMIVREINEKCK